ncbi:inositol monophosphatase family protein [Alkalihalobacillus trypoxylicola]|uniref:Inositol monophosphatase n=1 Tax=Alkalihalobacillus trypoxylicola TaxID=519424 RepID=A0A162FBK7_9BACI|nr:inositol monophosphatase family protein [Alkalihalobacillus trypoxylicola]KYG35222.1 inositol monophosphatase [Alkalihalobacillus trypoxylicola]GAF63925.1 myo-inositol-1(or 4)-monophosphatase [Bacillus sp. TS-2]
MSTWMEIEEIAKQWTIEAGERIKEALKNPIKVESKSNVNDLVTEVDKATEQFFYQNIKKTFPDHGFLGEEGVSEDGDINTLEGTVWIIDPIDGTMNFVHQKYNFAISVAVYHNGVGQIGLVYDVMSDELFSARKDHGAYLNGVELAPVRERALAESIIAVNSKWLVENKHPYQNPLSALVRDVRSIRSYGAAAIEIAYVAADRLDGYISVKLSPWDYAAGLVLLHEVGCKASSFTGDPLTLLDAESVIVGKPQLHKEMVSTYLGEEV